MANKKFLDTSGVGRLWSNVIRAISSAVSAESARAKEEEKRIEDKIALITETAYVEGEGIDIAFNQQGQRIISLEPGAIGDEHISSISISKVIADEGDILILNGGSVDE